MEEMEELAAHDIPFQICPGITAASAAAAAANISLTLRGLARKLVFVTAHAKSDEQLDLDWESLAEPGATLAVYMGKSSAHIISQNLIAAGMARDTPVMLVENASLENERIFHSSIDLLPIAAKTALGDGPAIMLIGQSVARDKNKLSHRRLLRVTKT